MPDSVILEVAARSSWAFEHEGERHVKRWSVVTAEKGRIAPATRPAFITSNPRRSGPTFSGQATTSSPVAAAATTRTALALAAGNRRTANAQIAQLKRENEYLERVVQTLEARIESLAEALAAARNGPTQKPSEKPAQPAIY